MVYGELLKCRVPWRAPVTACFSVCPCGRVMCVVRGVGRVMKRLCSTELAVAHARASKAFQPMRFGSILHAHVRCVRPGLAMCSVVE